MTPLPTNINLKWVWNHFFCLDLLSCGVGLFGVLFTVTSMPRTPVNPLFVFKHLSWLLCVSLSPCWLLWAVCLAGCQWSWSGRQPAVGYDAWFQRCVTADSWSLLSVYPAACLSVCLSESCLSVTVHVCFSMSPSVCLPVTVWVIKDASNIFIKNIINLASFSLFVLFMTWKYT